MSKFESYRPISNKFEIYNSPELNVLKDLFQTMPMMESYIANLIESYIYSSVEERHENGNIKAKYTTKYGEPHGKYTEWYDDGKVKIECNFKDGKLHGEYIHLQHVTIKTTFNEGKIHGFYTTISDKTAYFEEYIISQENYVDGKKEGVSIKYWGKDRVRVINNYSNNKLHGECKTYHQNGWLLQTEKYIDGIRNGEEVCYHSCNGGVKSRHNVINNKIQGEYLEYDRDGNISKRCYFVNDKKHGKEISYLRDGSIYSECEYVDGSKL